MGEQKNNTRQVGITILGWLIVGIATLVCVWQLQYFKRQLIGQYNLINERTSQLTKSDANRYKYILVPGTKKLLLVEPVYKYTNQSDIWALVNKTHTVQLAYIPKQLAPVQIPTYQNEQLQVRTELVEPLNQLYSAAEHAGIHLMVRSAYRSSQEQAAVTKEVDQGVAALPGQSEHQTGLAIDFNNQPVTCGYTCSLNTVSAQWLADNAYKYGFVLRYPEGKEVITGYPAEAWHYRYVGRSLATALQQSSLTYDEFYALFANARPRS